MEVSFAKPWHKSMAKELSDRTNREFGVPLGKRQALECVAYVANAVSVEALLKSGVPLEERAPDFGQPNWNFVRERLRGLKGMDPENVECVLAVLGDLIAEESDPRMSLAKRLARVIPQTSHERPEFGRVGCVALTEEDRDECAEVVMEDDFVDFKAEGSPYPALAVLGFARPSRQFNGRFQMEPAAPLNVLAHLCENWTELLTRV